MYSNTSRTHCSFASCQHTQVWSLERATLILDIFILKFRHVIFWAHYHLPYHHASSFQPLVRPLRVTTRRRWSRVVRAADQPTLGPSGTNGKSSHVVYHRNDSINDQTSYRMPVIHLERAFGALAQVVPAFDEGPHLRRPWRSQIRTHRTRVHPTTPLSLQSVQPRQLHLLWWHLCRSHDFGLGQALVHALRPIP